MQTHEPNGEDIRSSNSVSAIPNVGQVTAFYSLLKVDSVCVRFAQLSLTRICGSVLYVGFIKAPVQLANILSKVACTTSKIHDHHGLTFDNELEYRIS